MDNATESRAGKTEIVGGDNVPVVVGLSTSGTGLIPFAVVKDLLSDRPLRRGGRLRLTDLSEEDLADIAAADEALKDSTRILWTDLKDELGL